MGEIMRNRLRQRREALGMRQRDLAELTGSTLIRISRLETGAASMSVDELEALAAALDCTPEWLRGGEGEPTNSRVAVVRRLARELTPEERVALADELRRFRRPQARSCAARPVDGSDNTRLKKAS